jgi:hypothetical protein
MLQRCGLVIGLLMAASPVMAQDEVIKDLTTAEFEQFLRDDLQKTFEKAVRKGFVDYDIKDTPYFAVLNPGAKFILFQVRVPDAKANLDQLNAWNRAAVYSRVYLADKELIFEVPLGFAAGTTRAIMRNYYTQMEREFDSFKKALTKDQ